MFGALLLARQAVAPVLDELADAQPQRPLLGETAHELTVLRRRVELRIDAQLVLHLPEGHTFPFRSSATT